MTDSEKETYTLLIRAGMPERLATIFVEQFGRYERENFVDSCRVAGLLPHDPNGEPDLWICVDCLFSAEYGVESDEAEIDDPERRAEVQAGLDQFESIGAWGGEVEAHFSRSPCDCCGSSLAGDRHPAYAQERE